METGCISQETQLSLYIDERLEEAEKEAFEAHMEGCEACREAVEATRELRASVALRQAPEAPAFLMDRVMAQIQALPQEAGAAAATEAAPEAGGWLQGLLSMLPALRIAAPITSGVAACLLIWSLASSPAQMTPADTTGSGEASISEQMLFGDDEDTTSTKQLIQGLIDDNGDDDNAPATKGG